MNMAANMFERGQAHTDPGAQCFGGRKQWSLEMWMHLPIMVIIWSPPFDGKEQKLEQGIWLLQRSVATTERERA